MALSRKFRELWNLYGDRGLELDEALRRAHRAESVARELPAAVLRADEAVAAGDQARSVLRRIEWGTDGVCLDCGNEELFGHHAECDLAARIAPPLTPAVAAGESV